MENSTEKYALIFEFNNESPLFARVANQYIENKDFEQAITILEKGIFDYPEYPTAYYLYALALAHSGEKSEALVMARKAAGLQGTTESLKHYTNLIDEICSSFLEETLSVDSDKDIENLPALESEFAGSVEQVAEDADEKEVVELQAGIADENPDAVNELDSDEDMTAADEIENEIIIDDEFSEAVIEKNENIISVDDAGGIVIEPEEKKSDTQDDPEIEDDAGVEQIAEDENEKAADDASKDIYFDEDQNNAAVEDAGSILIDSSGVDSEDSLSRNDVTEDENNTVAEESVESVTETGEQDIDSENYPAGIITNDDSGQAGTGIKENNNLKPDADEIEDELDVLAEKLNKAVIPPISEDIEIPDNVPDNDTQFEGKSLVSETLAKIHFNQGNYNQALSIYETLIDIQPEKREYYETMIAQIKEKK